MASRVSKLIPSDPEKVMVIRKVNESTITCSTPFFHAGLFPIGGRGTTIRLSSGALAVFSPVALTEDVRIQMQKHLGSTDVRYIVALDQEHHIFLASWHNAWPEAKVFGPETLPALRKEQGYEPIDQSCWYPFRKTDKAGGLFVDDAFDQEFEMAYVDGHINKELVFHHKPTRTLIEADLLFNLPPLEQWSRTGRLPTDGYWGKLVTAINNTRGEAKWQKRLIWYYTSSADRRSYNRSVKGIADWDFDRIIPCHGDVIETGGKEVFRKVLAWHLEAAKKDH